MNLALSIEQSINTKSEQKRLAKPSPPGPLGARSAQGVLAMAGQVIVTRFLVLATQVVLAFKLSESDFGNAGLALAISSTLGIAASINIESVLIRKSTHIKSLSQTAFWLNTFFYALATCLILGSALWVKLFHGNDLLALLILTCAIALPFRSFAAIPNAFVTSELKFKLIAAIGLCNIAATSILSMMFAYLGFGPYSLIVPAIIATAISSLILFANVKFRPTFCFKKNVAKYLLRDIGIFWAVQGVWTAAGQIDYLIAGRMVNANLLGEYFFAYNLSLQAVRIATGNLYFIMFPVFSSMKDDAARQANAAFKVCRVMPIVLIPFCLAQGLLAPEIILHVYRGKWSVAGQLIAILSFGLAVYPISFIGEALLHAQGRFKDYFKVMTASLTAFALSITLATWWGGIQGTAIAASVHYLVFTPLINVVAFRKHRTAYEVIIGIYSGPVTVGLLCLGAGLLLHATLSSWAKFSDFTLTIGIGLFTPLLFLAFASILFPDRLQSVWATLQRHTSSAC